MHIVVLPAWLCITCMQLAVSLKGRRGGHILELELKTVMSSHVRAEN